MTLNTNDHTIAAISTPAGRGALGIVRVSGPNTIEILSSVISFKKYKSIRDLPAQKIARAHFNKNGEIIDEVTLSLFYGPHSYTGEDLAEIYCHGSTAVLKEILSTLLEKGARIPTPGEFTQRAFLNGKMDLAQAEAVAHLIHSKTDLSRRVALRQLEGELSNKLLQMRSQLIETLAHIEVHIDHSDDPTSGVAMSQKIVEEKLVKIIMELESLIESFKFGRMIQEGVRIAIVGKPNVGKSSLLNRLLKVDRAIVTEIPGTTRDTLEEGFDLFGLPALLVDTAGIREGAPDIVEKLGMERTQHCLENADVVLLILDQSIPLSKEDEKMARLTQQKEKVLILLNKNDLPPKFSIQEMKTHFPGRPSLSISSLENKGIEQVLEELYKLTLGKESESLPEVLITSLRHKECLTACKKSLEEAVKISKAGAGEEVLALEIRSGCDALGEIVGEVVTEDILSAIFSKFCIGK